MTNPGEAIARVILIGPPGSGKTYVLNSFQSRIQKQRIMHPDLNVTLNCITVNCLHHDSTKTVVFEIIKKIDPYFTASVEDCTTAELQYILADILNEKREAIIIIFDNIDTEGKTKDEPNLFSQILVAQDLDFLTSLDRSVFRRVVTDVIPFEAYTAQQSYQLLKDHIKKKVRLKISEDTIWFISMISQGNMHYGFELLKGSQTYAQHHQHLTIVPEHIRNINKRLTDFKITKRMLKELPLGEKLMLLTIARRFKNNSKAFINFLELPSLYISICEEYDTMQTAKFFSEVLERLEKSAIISLHNIDKDVILTLSEAPATELSATIEKDLKAQRKENPIFL
ncbi:MAG: AAA family ATPase [Candidatus Heimdallarchaeota archaeon]